MDQVALRQERKTVFFRVDSSRYIGTGHVYRCLALAHQLRTRHGMNVEFMAMAWDGNIASLIEKRGFRVHRLNPLTKDISSFDPSLYNWREDALQCERILRGAGSRPMWMVVDAYFLDHRWEEAMGPHVDEILVIDDLANRTHVCTCILDQNYPEDPAPYRPLVPDEALILKGPKYALLTSGFEHESWEDRDLLERKDSSHVHVLIFMGGTDPKRATIKILRGLKDYFRKTGPLFYVLAPRSNPDFDAIQRFCEDLDTVVHIDYVEDMPSFLKEMDLVIGAGGVSTYERMAMGIPQILLSVAENQYTHTCALAENGFVVFLGAVDMVKPQSIKGALDFLLSNPPLMGFMTKRSRALVDGLGARRVSDLMAAFGLEVREATLKDMWLIFEWRNSEPARMASFNTSCISKSDHERWFKRVLKARDRKIYMGVLGEKSIGMVRFDINSQGEAMVSILLSPEFMGKGLGWMLLNRAIEAFKMECPEVDTLKALVKEENIASKRTFEKAGFSQAYTAFIKRF